MSSESVASAEGPSLWTCGAPFKHPLPEEDGDPWETLLKPMLERDKEQCETWKAEVENLLIFAGLFSAVVTTFVVESYKGLQPDPNQEIISLLSQLVTRFDAPLSNTSAAPLLAQLPSSSPPSGISRVNVLWFISLVLSLTTVLIGTVGLQWLREHQRYPHYGTSMDRFALFNMRAEGLKKWYVPQVFLVLPVILQLALVLFLIGLIDFLLLIARRSVFGPIIAVIGCPIVFIVVTTILPALQWTFPPAKYVRLRGLVPSQCAYKSPQASVFSAILTQIFILPWRLLSLLVHPIYKYGSDNAADLVFGWVRKLAYFNERLSLPADLTALEYRERCAEQLYCEQWAAHCPINLKEHLASILPVHDTNIALPPVYDCIAGLKSTGGAGLNSRNMPSDPAASYRCIQLLATLPQKVFTHDAAWHQYLQNVMLWHNWLWDRDEDTHISSAYLVADGADTVPMPVSTHVHIEETAFILFRTAGWDRKSPWVAKRVHERYIRLMNYYFATSVTRRNVKLDAGLFQGYFVAAWDLGTGVSNYREFSTQYTTLLEVLFADRAVQSSTDVDILADDCSLYGIETFVETACRNQNQDDSLSTLHLIERQMLMHFTPSAVRNVPQQYLLFILMATYLGATIGKSESQASLDKAGADVAGVAQGLVLPLGQCGEQIRISQVQAESRRWTVHGGYRWFVREYEARQGVENAPYTTVDISVGDQVSICNEIG